MSRPTLYGHPLSPYSRKSRLTLLLGDVDHDFTMVAPHADEPAFREASPLGKIPAFRDKDAAFSDSSVIAHYVMRFYPGGANLLPETPADYARALWFEEYADTVLMPVIGGHLFAEVVLAERLFRRAPLQSDIDKAINDELPKIYAFLNDKLQHSPWLTGEQISIGDVAVGGLMLSLYHCGQTIPDSAPQLRDFAERFFALPAVQQTMAEEIQVLKAMNYDTPLAGRLAG